MPHSPELIKDLEEKLHMVRQNILRIFEASSQGHCGGTMSLTEIVTALYFHHLKLDPGNPDWPERDRLVLSKAHAAESIYAVLPEVGYVPKETLDEYYLYGSRFQDMLIGGALPVSIIRAARLVRVYPSLLEWPWLKKLRRK